MSPQKKASLIVDRMWKNDAMSQWLGIERMEDGPGISTLRMRVRAEMLNGFSIAHGGICYSLADTALAFAANSHGIHAMSLETSISHLLPVKENDILITEVLELNLTRSTGLYLVYVRNGSEQIVACFKGTVFRSGKEWSDLNP